MVQVLTWTCLLLAFETCISDILLSEETLRWYTPNTQRSFTKRTHPEEAVPRRSKDFREDPYEFYDRLPFLVETPDEEYEDGRLETVDTFDDRYMVQGQQWGYSDRVKASGCTTNRPPGSHGLYVNIGTRWRRSVSWGAKSETDEVMFEKVIDEPPNLFSTNLRRIRLIQRGYNITRISILSKLYEKPSAGSAKVHRGGVGQHGAVIYVRVPKGRYLKYIIKIWGYRL